MTVFKSQQKEVLEMHGFWTDLKFYSRFLRETGLTQEDVEIKVRDLRRVFGGWEWEITELLGHYYSGTLSFPVLPQFADLWARAGRAIFWHPFEKVRGSFRPGLRENIGEKGIALYRIFDFFKQEFSFHDWRMVREGLDGMPGVHEIRIESILLDGLRESGLDPDDDLWKCIALNIRLTLICAVGYLIIKRDNESFKSLLALWRSGNLPIGFDKDNTLVVLCKE